MAEVTVIGNTLADLNFDLPAEFLHRSGSVSHQQSAITLPFGTKLEAKAYALTPGGSGANVAVGLQRAGTAVTLLTILSSDTLGEFLRRSLNETGLRLLATETATPSNLSVILRVKGERTIISVHPGRPDFRDQPLPAVGHLHIAPLPDAADNFYPHLTEHRAKTSQTVSFNPSQEAIEGRGRHLLIALRSATILVVNQLEAATLARLPQRSAPMELVRSLLRLGPAVVVVTCADKGAYAGSEVGIFHVSALADRTTRVDTTGAGDAFTSGFLTGYLDQAGQNPAELMKEALAFGAVNASAAVSEIGGQTGLLSRADLEHGARGVTLKKMEEQ